MSVNMPIICILNALPLFRNENGVALTIHDGNDIALVTSVGDWAKQWLQYRDQGMSVSRYLNSKTDKPFFRFYEEGAYEHTTGGLIRSYSGSGVPEVFFSLVVLRQSLINFI